MRRKEIEHGGGAGQTDLHWYGYDENFQIQRNDGIVERSEAYRQNSFRAS